MTREENIREARKTLGLLRARLMRLRETAVRVAMRRLSAKSEQELELVQFIETLVEEAEADLREKLHDMANLIMRLEGQKT